MRKVLWLALALTLVLAPVALAESAPAAVDLGLLAPAGCDSAPNATVADDGNAGLEELDLFAPAEPLMQPPTCPTTSVCPTGCPPGPFCLVGFLGQCCSAGGGFLRCCPPGKTIQVKSCPCQGCPGQSQVSVACV